MTCGTFKCTDFIVLALGLLVSGGMFYRVWFRAEEFKEWMADVYTHPGARRMARSGLNLWLFRIGSILGILLCTIAILVRIWALLTQQW